MKKLVYLLLIVLFVLHQDFWNWDSRTLVFGFLPAGMAYHSLYSIVTAVLWILAIKWAWPHAVERWAEEKGASE